MADFRAMKGGSTGASVYMYLHVSTVRVMTDGPNQHDDLVWLLGYASLNPGGGMFEYSEGDTSPVPL